AAWLGQQRDNRVVVVLFDQRRPRGRNQHLVGTPTVMQAQPDVRRPDRDLLDAGLVPSRAVATLTLGPMAPLLPSPRRRDTPGVEVVRDRPQRNATEQTADDLTDDLCLGRVLPVLEADDPALVVVLVCPRPAVQSGSVRTALLRALESRTRDALPFDLALGGIELAEDARHHASRCGRQVQF